VTRTTSDEAEAAELAAAAVAHAARAGVLAAIGELAASPLDQRSAVRMRTALSRASSPPVRAALLRLGAGHSSAVPESRDAVRPVRALRAVQEGAA